MAKFRIQKLLGRRFHGRYSPEDIASALVLAASRKTSTSRICLEHERAPSEGMVRYSLRGLTLKPLLKRANRLLAKQAATRNFGHQLGDNPISTMRDSLLSIQS